MMRVCAEKFTKPSNSSLICRAPIPDRRLLVVLNACHAAVHGDGLIHVLDAFHYVNASLTTDEPEQTPILKVGDLDLNFSIAVAPTEVSESPKTSEVAREVEDIREQIVRGPIAGAKALSEHLENHPDLAARRNEVDLKRLDPLAGDHGPYDGRWRLRLNRTPADLTGWLVH